MAVLSSTQIKDCGAKNEIKSREPIRCRECGHRIMYKKRTKRSTFLRLSLRNCSECVLFDQWCNLKLGDECLEVSASNGLHCHNIMVSKLPDPPQKKHRYSVVAGVCTIIQNSPVDVGFGVFRMDNLCCWVVFVAALLSPGWNPNGNDNDYQVTQLWWRWMPGIARTWFWVVVIVTSVQRSVVRAQKFCICLDVPYSSQVRRQRIRVGDTSHRNPSHPIPLMHEDPTNNRARSLSGEFDGVCRSL